MELVWTDKVFRLLGNITFVVSRLQFWRDRCLHDVIQRLAYRFIFSSLGSIAYKILYKRFRNTGIHGIHAHVVTVIGTPAQRKLAEVARTDDKSAQLITQIHQDLRAFTSLCILIRSVMYTRIVTYILEMLQYGSRNINFTDCHSKILHECHGILIGTVSGTEPWHGDTYNALTVESQLVKSLGHNEQGKCGVKSTADTDNSSLAVGMNKSFSQSADLYIEDFLTGILHVLRLGNEWMLVEMACQHELTHKIEWQQTIYPYTQLANLPRNTCQSCSNRTLCIDKGTVCPTFAT